MKQGFAPVGKPPDYLGKARANRMLDREQYNIDKERTLKEQMDELSEYFTRFIQKSAGMRERKINNLPDEAIVEKVRSIPIPTAGRDPKEVGYELVHTILDNGVSLNHPRFFSFVAGAVSPYSFAGSVLTDLYNQNAGSYSLYPATATIEEKLIAWAGGLAGFDPKKCGGVFTSGGSLSNLTGMIAARECKLPGRFDLANAVAFCSTQGHSSIRKGMRMLGLRNDQIVQIGTDENFRIRTDLLREAIVRSIDEGRKPFLIVGSMGTTNTGSIDPLNELADIAAEYGMWLHVDGAYGGSILISDIYRNLAKGLKRADSFSWDFHKWSLQVYSCGCVVVKDRQNLVNAFAEHPEYLADVINEEHNDGWDLGIEMSRPTRYIKLWYTLQAMGTDLLADVIDYAFYNASIAAKRMHQLEGWEIVSKPMCGTVNVRYAPEGVSPEHFNRINQLISEEIINSGYAYIVTTVLNGSKCLRLCMINGNTETSDVIITVEKLDEIAKDIVNNRKYL